MVVVVVRGEVEKKEADFLAFFWTVMGGEEGEEERGAERKWDIWGELRK